MKRGTLLKFVGLMWWCGSMSAWAEEAFASLFLKADVTLGYSVTDQVVTGGVSVAAVEWGKLISFPRLALDASTRWEGLRPALDLGIDLRALAERLGGEWRLDKSLVLSASLGADLNSGKPLGESLKFMLKLSVMTLKP